MKIEVILFRAGIPDADGKIHTATELHALAATDPKNFRIDEEGNLRRLCSDEETAEIEAKLAGSGYESTITNEAINKFAEVLKTREERGLPSRRPVDGENSWFPVTLSGDDGEDN